MYNPRSRLSSPTVLGIDERWERVLCYLGVWVTGLIFLLIENKNSTVRRHAMQSVVVFGTLSLLTAVLGLFGGALVGLSIPLISGILGLGFGLLKGLIGLVTFGLWILLMVLAYRSPETFIGSRFNRYL
jgi:uncharacterized membrane protein